MYPAQTGEVAVVILVLIRVGILNDCRGGALRDNGYDLYGQSAEVEAGEAVVIRCLGGDADRGLVGTLARGAILRANPEGVVVGEQHLGVGAVGDGVLARDRIGSEIDDGEIAGKEPVRLQLLARDIERSSVGHRRCDAAGDQDLI